MTQQAKILVGVDWGTEEHAVVGVDDGGAVLFEKRVDDTGAALQELVDEIKELASTRDAEVKVGIETSHGHVAATFVIAGFDVFTLNPKQLDRFRDRFSMAGAKDDRLDAHVLATSLRTDEERYTKLELLDEHTTQLREWSRLRDDLVAERLAQCSKLREALLVYFPQFVRAVGDLSALWVLDLLMKCPTPAHAKKLQPKWLETLFKKRRVRSTKARDLLAKLRVQPVVVAPGIIKAKRGQVKLLVAQLRLSREQLRTVEDEIDELLDTIHQEQVPSATASKRARRVTSRSSSPSRE